MSHKVRMVPGRSIAAFDAIDEGATIPAECRVTYFGPTNHPFLIEYPDASVGQATCGAIRTGLRQCARAVDRVGRGGPVAGVVEFSVRPTQLKWRRSPSEHIWEPRPLELAPQGLAARQLAREHVRRDAGQVEPQDVNLEPAFVRFICPMLDGVEVAIGEVEVPPVEVEYSSSVHDLTPLEGAKHVTRPTQLLEWAGIDLAPVVDGEVPVAVRAEVPPSPRAAKADRFGVGEPSACSDDHVDELFIGHKPIVSGAARAVFI